MKGDFSRQTFDPKKHYSAVLMQQGRVQLDADWNEQRAIDRHRIETEARDLIGAGGGQAGSAGFEIGVHNGETLSIGPGNFYVDGILCHNEGLLLFENQPDLPGTRAIDLLKGDMEVGLIYLDVWERHITGLEDGAIREVALGGPDTATRTKTVWQAKVLPVQADTSDIPALQALLEEHVKIASQLETGSGKGTDDLRAELARTDRRILNLLGVDCDGKFGDELLETHPPSTGRLLARALPPARAESPCVLPPGAGYERLENQLYRVEIHVGGERAEATFKWSRDNGSVTTAVLGVTQTGTGTQVSVRDVGPDEMLGFASGHYVDLVDDSRELFNAPPGQLVQITGVDPARRTITVNAPLPDVASREHPKLRRWDSLGAIPIPEQEEAFVELEGGIEVQFSGDRFNTGDYWLIPARTATGGIEWPENQPQPPAGVRHHYARLALVMAATVADEGQPPEEESRVASRRAARGTSSRSRASGKTSPRILPTSRVRRLLVLADCRRLYPPVTELTSLFYLSGDGQEAGSGQRLPRPLVVGVANGDRPVVGAQVEFEVQTEDNEEPYDGRLEAPGENPGTSVKVTTDARGEARCFWTLATNRASQQVRASLVDGTHLSVYFNANLSAAGEAVDESIQVTRLLVGPPGSQEQDLRLDGVVPVNSLASGIRIECDPNSVIDQQTVVGKPTCFVTVDLPYPDSASDRARWGEPPLVGFVGFQPLVLAAQLSVANGNRIVWTPTTVTGAWLRDRLFQATPAVPAELTARLTLKGNFIWDSGEGETLAYLDGDVFGGRRLDGPGFELQFPSGDGRRGGDFEMWFRIVAQTLLLDSVTLDRREVVGGATQVTTGTVRLIGGTAPADGTQIALQSSDPAVLLSPVNATSPPARSTNVTIVAGQSSVDFRVTTQPVASTKTATITATLTPPAPGTPTTRTVNLVVRAPELESLTLSPGNSVTPSPGTIIGKTGTVQGTVTLTGRAPQGGVDVALESDSAAAKLRQQSVIVPAGSNSATFPVDTEPVGSALAFKITATAQSISRTATMTIQPPTANNLTLNPSSVRGGSASTATLGINGPAPANFDVSLDSTDTNRATVPEAVTVPANTQSVTFTVSTKAVASDGPVTIRALRPAGVVQRTASLTVLAPDLTDFTFDTSPITGGASTTGRLTLNGPAPSGTFVDLSPTSNSAATFPERVTVQPNATQAAFTATGQSFTGTTNRSVTVTASYSLGGTLAATLTVRPTKSKEKEKEKESEKQRKEKESEKLTAQERTPLIGRFGPEGPETAEAKLVGKDKEGPTPGRPFVQPAERTVLGQQALDQLSTE